MSTSLETFLAAYSPEVRDLTLKVRALVLSVIPDAIEQVDPPSKLIGYGYGLKYADIICVIMPLKSAVNLGLYRGAELPDPKGLLEGTGKLSRHVKIKTETEIKNPALRALLKASVAAKNTDLVLRACAMDESMALATASDILIDGPTAVRRYVIVSAISRG